MSDITTSSPFQCFSAAVAILLPLQCNQARKNMFPKATGTIDEVVILALRSKPVKIRLEFPQNRKLPPPCWILSRSQFLWRHRTRTTRHGEDVFDGITRFTISSQASISKTSMQGKNENWFAKSGVKLECSTFFAASRKKPRYI